MEAPERFGRQAAGEPRQEERGKRPRQQPAAQQDRAQAQERQAQDGDGAQTDEAFAPLVPGRRSKRAASSVAQLTVT